jgi:asparagine synthase (glutamine-hydrolysing)
MMSAAQLTATNLPMLLHWEDRASMAHSIEARVPFLDYRLVEFVLGLPEEFKLSGGVTKRVQRTGMNGVIPDGIRDRMDKVGFATPEELWVKAQGTDFFRAQLRQAVDRSQGILGEESFSMLEDMISGQRPFSYLPWRLINFGEWMHTFSVSKI